MLNPEFIQLLKDKYNIVFNDISVLEEAFTHASYVNEHRNMHLAYNERLEFMGDAVLQYLISNYIFNKYPKMPEGKLSPLRSFIVREDSLADFARECHFDKYILLGKGEEASGGRSRSSLLCDLFEAFIGAVSQDLGLAKAWDFVEQVMIPKIDSGYFEKEKDFKTALQEELQKSGDVHISYHLVGESGPAHERVFETEVYLGDKVIGKGSGRSKKAAEQKAAEDALNALKG